MKPADHPEFFRRPPPEGRSRESSIVLDREGRFWHDGLPVTHPGMARAFASWIGRHPDDGRYILNNGYDWTYFTVEDAPFVVVALHDAQGTRPELELSDGTREPLEPEKLELTAEGVLYVRVKGDFPARFSRAAQLALEPLLDEDGGEPVLCLGGARRRLARPA